MVGSYYCGQCRAYLDGSEVTYEETHDKEGCGLPVVWVEYGSEEQHVIELEQQVADLQAEVERLTPLAAVCQNADSHTDVQPTIEMLRAEVDELADALAGRHEHPPEYELVQIGGIALSWLRRLGVVPPPRRDLVADAALGAAVRKLATAPWHEAGPGEPVLAYCFDWSGERASSDDDDCGEIWMEHPIVLGWGVTDIYYAEGIPNLTWHDTPDAALCAAGLMGVGDANGRT